MINRKRKAYYVKKEVAKAEPYNPRSRRQSIGGSRFSRSDSDGGYSSLKKLVCLALILFVIWVLKESFLSINIFQ